MDRTEKEHQMKCVRCGEVQPSAVGMAIKMALFATFAWFFLTVVINPNNLFLGPSLEWF